MKCEFMTPAWNVRGCGRRLVGRSWAPGRPMLSRRSAIAVESAAVGPAAEIAVPREWLFSTNYDALSERVLEIDVDVVVGRKSLRGSSFFLQLWTDATLARWSTHAVQGPKAHATALHKAARELCEVDGALWLPQAGPPVEFARFRQDLEVLLTSRARHSAPVVESAQPLRQSSPDGERQGAGERCGRTAARPRNCEGRSRAPGGRRGAAARRTGGGSDRGGSDGGGGGGSGGPGGGEGDGDHKRRNSRRPRRLEALGVLGTWVAAIAAVLALVVTLATQPVGPMPKGGPTPRIGRCAVHGPQSKHPLPRRPRRRRIAGRC